MAATIHSQLGASMMRNGTGRPNSQPAISIRLRPMRSENRPATRFASALTSPKVTMKERAIVRGGQAELVLGQQRHDRALDADHAADEGVDEHQQRELLPVVAQAEPDRRGRRARRWHSGWLRLPDRSGRRRRLAGLVEGDDRGVVGRRGRDARRGSLDERRSRQAQHGDAHRHLAQRRGERHARRRRPARWCARAGPASRAAAASRRCERGPEQPRPLPCLLGVACRSGRPTPARKSVSPVKSARSSSR